MAKKYKKKKSKYPGYMSFNKGLGLNPAYGEYGGWLDELPTEYEDGGKLMYQQDMGRLPIYVDDLNHPRLKAYNDSTTVYNNYANLRDIITRGGRYYINPEISRPIITNRNSTFYVPNPNNPIVLRTVTDDFSFNEISDRGLPNIKVSVKSKIKPIATETYTRKESKYKSEKDYKKAAENIRDFNERTGEANWIGYDIPRYKQPVQPYIYRKAEQSISPVVEQKVETPVVQQPIAIDPSMLTYRISMLPESEQRGNQKYVATVVPETYTKYGTGFAERYPLTQEQVDKMGESDTMKSYEGKDVPVKYIKGFKQGGFIGKTTVEAGGAKHVVYTGKNNHIMVTHPEMDNGAWDTIDLTKVSDAQSLAQGVDATLDWHRKHPHHKYKKAEGGYMSPLDLNPKTLKRYKKDLMIQENADRSGYNEEKGLWFPHESVEGGLPTIGYGHKLTSAGQYSKGLTDKQVLDLLDKDIKEHEQNAKRIVDEKYTKGTFDKLSQDKQMLLTDYSYNGVLSKFPTFTEGVVYDDRPKMLEQYKRYTDGTPLKKRNAWTLSVLQNMPTREEEKLIQEREEKLAKDMAAKEAMRIAAEKEAAKPWYTKAYEYIKQAIPFEEGGSYRGNYRRPMYNDKRIGAGPDGGERWVYQQNMGKLPNQYSTVVTNSPISSKSTPSKYDTTIGGKVDPYFKATVDAAGAVYYPAAVLGSAIDFYEGDYTGAGLGLIPFVGKGGRTGRFFANAYTTARNAGVPHRIAYPMKKGLKAATIGAAAGANAYDAINDFNLKLPNNLNFLKPVLEGSENMYEEGGWLDEL